MHILHVLESAGGGSGRVVLDLIHGQIRQGHTVTLVYSPLRTTPDFVRDIATLQRATVITLPMRRAVGLWDVVPVLKLAWIIHQVRPDVVHAHSSKAGACARLARWGRPSARQVYTPHAFVTLDPKASRLYCLIERFLAFFSNAIIAVSENELRHARDVLRIPAHKVHVVVNAIALDNAQLLSRDDARDALGVPHNSRVIGFVGRMTAQKNPLRALAAFRAILGSYPDHILVMLGDGDGLDAVRQAIIRDSLDTRVRVYTDREARAVMPAFDVLLASSDFEGFPVVFLEALAAGVPIVTTPVGGAIEAVTSQTGRIAEDFTVAALAHALDEVLRLPEDGYHAMRDAAHRHAEEFTQERMLATTQGIYDCTRH